MGGSLLQWVTNLQYFMVIDQPSRDLKWRFKVFHVSRDLKKQRDWEISNFMSWSFP